MNGTANPSGVRLFISYAHEDESYLKDFEKHLIPLREAGLVTEWHDRKIRAGQKWNEEIQSKLESAEIFIFMLSNDFMGSEYSKKVELNIARKKQKEGKATIIPMLIRPVDWEETVFGDFQAIPTDANPVSEWKSRDAAFVNVIKHLREICKEMKGMPGEPEGSLLAEKDIPGNRGYEFRPEVETRKQERKPREEALTLDQVIAGTWNVTSAQPIGPPISGTFTFEASGLFSGQFYSPMAGMISVQGQFRVQFSTLFMQGMQSNGIATSPYMVQVTFGTITGNHLRGSSMTGEYITCNRV